MPFTSTIYSMGLDCFLQSPVYLDCFLCSLQFIWTVSSVVSSLFGLWPLHLSTVSLTRLTKLTIIYGQFAEGQIKQACSYCILSVLKLYTQSNNMYNSQPRVISQGAISDYLSDYPFLTTSDYHLYSALLLTRALMGPGQNQCTIQVIGYYLVGILNHHIAFIQLYY